MRGYIKRIHFINFFNLFPLLLSANSASQPINQPILPKKRRMRDGSSRQTLILGPNFMLNFHKLMQAITPPTANIQPASILNINNNNLYLIFLFVVFDHIMLILDQFGGFFCILEPELQFLGSVGLDCLGE